MTQSQVLSILKTGANVFLTGGPGSGKTYVINEYVAYLRSRGIEPAVTASTGIAATHIGGMTIHSWTGIGIKNNLDKYALNKIADSSYIAKRVRKAKVLIIEEVSMLTGKTLLMVDAVCREIKQNQAPFGGLQVIFAGDFFQLPPVVKRETANQTAFLEEKHFAYDSPAWINANPTVCYLTEQHRQDDSNFLDVLVAIRNGTFNDNHLNHILSRKIDSNAVPKNIPKLFSHNADVNRINDEILGKLPGKRQVFRMLSEGPDVLVTSLKKGCLSPEELSLKVGAAVMFTKNNPKDGFVNGTLGIVSRFNRTDGCPIVKIRNGRQIKVEPMDWTMEENGKVRARVSQYPLRLAWAITVHKSQGMNLDEAVIDLSDVFEYGQGYVALSRVRRLSGLYMLGWNEKAFQVHPEILAKDDDFRIYSSNGETMFSDISINELQKRQNNFIDICGGKQRPINAENISTCSATLLLWNEGKNILQIAKIRELKERTILIHIEKLVIIGKINRADLSRIIPPSLNRSLPKIHNAFRELNFDKLTPVFEKFEGEYSFDELRIARMLLYEKSATEIPVQSKQSGFEEIRKTYPNAYQPWDKTQDEKLRELFKKGSSITNLTNILDRTKGSIRSRLIKLGLIK